MSRTINYYILLLLCASVAAFSYEPHVTAGPASPVVRQPAATLPAGRPGSTAANGVVRTPMEQYLNQAATAGRPVPFVAAAPSAAATPVAAPRVAHSASAVLPSSAPAPPKTAVVRPSRHGRTYKIKVVATAYHFDGYGGLTSRGTQVGHGTIAVDPRVIPYYAKIYVPGYGWGRALDCGSAIKGRRVDLWMRSEGTANTWGRRTVEITVVLP